MGTYDYSATDPEIVSQLYCLLCGVCSNDTSQTDYIGSYYYSQSSFYYDYDEMDEAFIDQHCPKPYRAHTVGLTTRLVIGVVFSVTVFLSVCGNTLAITILAFGNRVRTHFNSYLINLAVSDLVMAIMCMPFTTIALALEQWPFGAAMCPLVVYLQQVSVAASVYTLTAIAIDRYMAVVHPLRAKTSVIRPAFVNITIWVASMLLGIVQLFKAKRRAYVIESGEIYYQCDEVWLNRKHKIIYELFIIVITYIGPLAVISYSYCAVVKSLWSRNLPGNPDEIRDQRNSKSKRKVAKMAVIVVILFALFWLPLHTLMFLTTCTPFHRSSRETFELVQKIYMCFYWLAMANSFINPFVYTIYHKGFRTDLCNICTLCRRSGRCYLSRISTPPWVETTISIRSKTATTIKSRGVSRSSSETKR
ncbi:QRFP-like peptide receptor [Ptychodera flava]|uniref:QRFP-like peptide receptor n=1 Tax=Ptychodera flava TaxID=63121 RepID=UPI003969D372